MQKRKLTLTWGQGCVLFIVSYIIVISVVFYAAGEQLFSRVSRNQIEHIPGSYATEDVTPDYRLRQDFHNEIDELEKVIIRFTAFSRINSGDVIVEIIDHTRQQSVFKNTWDIADVQDGQEFICEIPKKFGDAWQHDFSILIGSENSSKGSGIAPMYAAEAGDHSGQLYLNEQPVEGTLCFSTYGRDVVWTGSHYWEITSVIGLILTLLCLWISYKRKKNKKSIVVECVALLQKYKFLIKQMVSRDFKIKYRRSVLGASWSLINPLLMMLVQYFIFANLFMRGIPNYPVYLLSGVVLFNFFSESTNTAIGAIAFNGELVKKVYVPKCIYPVSKVLSTTINLLISLIPVVALSLFSGVRPTKAWLLIPFVLICLLIFCIGVGLILSAVMVFFRDLQFLWSVLIMVFTYATPIFYPESILPKELEVVIQFNPMYQYISFFRTIVIQGISPEPMEYIKCMAISMVFLLIGSFVFKKTQDKFIFHI